MYACVCSKTVCVQWTHKTQLVRTRHCLAQTAVCSRTCLALPSLAAAAEEPTSKLTGSESVYNREGQMPWAKSWWLVLVMQQAWLGLSLTYLITPHLWASTYLTFEQVESKGQVPPAVRGLFKALSLTLFKRDLGWDQIECQRMRPHRVSKIF